MFTFAAPEMVLLILVPIFARVLFPSDKRSNEAIPKVQFPYIARITSAFSGKGKGPRKKGTPWWFVFLLWVLWLSLTAAMMRPQIVDQFTEIKSEGYDLMLAVDLSVSMSALDFSNETGPLNRLDVTKRVVSRFVKEREGDRVGLVLFGENAYLHVPLTLDTLAVGQMLERTVIGMAGDATAIGDAIGVAVKTLRDRPEGSRVIILLTDGENTAGTLPPLQGAELAKQYDIKIYTIGVGSNGPVPVPDKKGNVRLLPMKLDEKLLNDIAKITGGRYFKATNEQALYKIYEDINQLEKTKSETKEYFIRKPLFEYPLLLAIASLSLMMLFPLLRRLRHAF